MASKSRNPQISKDRADAEKQTAAIHASGFVGDALAFDKSSVRSIDQDGRMHISETNVSKANICPYLGHEIPGHEKLGLDPDKVYQLLRDPKELEAAVSTFNNIPVLSSHVAVSAEDHKPGDVVGSTGTDAKFASPYLMNSMVIWAAEAIKGIESGEKRELSCAYRYVPVMKPGTYNGVHYDGRMTEIQGNHVALVPKGRAGSDVVVGDSAIMETKQMALKKKTDRVKGAIPALVKLSQDANIDGLIELLDKLQGENKEVEVPTEADPQEEIPDGPCATDDPDPEAPPPGSEAPAEEPKDGPKDAPKDNDDAVIAKVRKALEQIVAMLKSPEATSKAEEPVGDDPIPTEQTPGKPERKEIAVSKSAMDATLAAHGKKVESATIARLRAISAAENEVRPIVGQLFGAFDSAEAVYCAALKSMGVDTAGITEPVALKALVHAHGTKRVAAQAHVAMDAAAVSDFDKAFPSVKRIRIM